MDELEAVAACHVQAGDELPGPGRIYVLGAWGVREYAPDGRTVQVTEIQFSDGTTTRLPPFTAVMRYRRP
jgi:hypothetical protein